MIESLLFRSEKKRLEVELLAAKTAADTSQTKTNKGEIVTFA